MLRGTDNLAALDQLEQEHVGWVLEHLPVGSAQLPMLTESAHWFEYCETDSVLASVGRT